MRALTIVPKPLIVRLHFPPSVNRSRPGQGRNTRWMKPRSDLNPERGFSLS
jgi:hypothetical protein